MQWRPVEGAVHYRYRLLSKGKRILQSRTAETSIHLGAGDPGKKYTARVRAKTENGISKWASVKTKCRAAAPTPDPSVSISFYYISRDAVFFGWSWKRLPAAVESIYISIRPDYDFDCDGRTNQYDAFEEGEGRYSYAGLCPNTSHHVEFATVDKSGTVNVLKKEHFRTLP